MVACDIGQGDASVLNAGGGSAVVIDAGPEPATVDACLRRLHIDHVVLMVFTHGHADHIDGWEGVKRHRQVDQILYGPSGGPGGAIPRHEAVLGEAFSVGEMQFQVLGPMPGPDFRADAEGGSTANNSSVVLSVATHGIRLMMAGDAEPEEQEFILRQGFDLHADILKMPHHGSARQSQEFFEAVVARAATISDGKDNDYGHPAPAALALLRKLGMAAYRTDRQGDIAVVVRDGQLSVLTR
jgi:competence protein ComEC